MRSEAIKIVFFLVWFVSLFLGGINIKKSALYLLLLLGSAGGIFVPDLHVKILSWLFSFWIAFLISSNEGGRAKSGLCQKYFMIQIFGALLAALGVALKSLDSSMVLVLCGVLISGPTFLHSLMFGGFFKSLSKRAFLYSIATPALVGIDILFTVKSDIKQNYSVFFDISLLLVGSITLCYNSFAALARNETKPLLISFVLSWVGVLMVLLPSENPNLPLALSSVFVFIFSFFMLYVEARRFNKKTFGIMTSMFFTTPLFAGFNAVFYSVRAAQEYSMVLPFLLLFAFMLQSAAIVLNLKKSSISETKPGLKLVLLSAVSVVAAVAIHCVGLMHAVG